MITGVKSSVRASDTSKKAGAAEVASETARPSGFNFNNYSGSSDVFSATNMVDASPSTMVASVSQPDHSGDVAMSPVRYLRALRPYVWPQAMILRSKPESIFFFSFDFGRQSFSSPLFADSIASSSLPVIPEQGWDTPDSVPASSGADPGGAPRMGNNDSPARECGLTVDDCGRRRHRHRARLYKKFDTPGCGDVRVEFSGGIPTPFRRASCAWKADQGHLFIRTLPPAGEGSPGTSGAAMDGTAMVGCIPPVVHRPHAPMMEGHSPLSQRRPSQPPTSRGSSRPKAKACGYKAALINLPGA